MYMNMQLYIYIYICQYMYRGVRKQAPWSFNGIQQAPNMQKYCTHAQITNRSQPKTNRIQLSIQRQTRYQINDRQWPLTNKKKRPLGSGRAGPPPRGRWGQRGQMPPQRGRHTYIYIYTYIYKEREIQIHVCQFIHRLCSDVYIYTYTSKYTCIHICTYSP